MTTQLETSVNRFIQNEDRINVFVNGNDSQGYTPTTGGPEVPSLRKFLSSFVKAGLFNTFPTEAELLASVPTSSYQAAKALDTGRIFYWQDNQWNSSGDSEKDQVLKILRPLVENAATGSARMLSALQEHIMDDIKYREMQEWMNSLFTVPNKLKTLTNIQLMGTGISGGVQTNTGLKPHLENLVYFPEPRSAVQIFITTDGVVPASKGTVVNGTMQMIVDGISLNCPCTFEVQGSSSAAYPKKSLTFAFFADEQRKTPIAIKLGDLIPFEELVYKANWIDTTHVRNIVCNRLWNKFQDARDTFPFRDTHHAYKGKTGVATIDTTATGNAAGYPCFVYINESFYGIGDINIGKKRQNYNISKDKPKELLVEMGHWCDMSHLDFETLGWNGSPLVELKAPKTRTAETTQVITAWQAWTRLPQAEFNAQANTYIDKTNMVDFLLFVEFIEAVDLVSSLGSQGKNFLISSYNGTKWLFHPYDHDSVLGLRFDGAAATAPGNRYFNPATMEANGFFTKVYTLYQDDIKLRYADLRRKGILTESFMNKLVVDLMDKFTAEAYKAEAAMWPGMPSLAITNIEQILTWVKGRIALMDSIYQYTP